MDTQSPVRLIGRGFAEAKRSKGRVILRHAEGRFIAPIFAD
jgi:hypothetical protein